MTLFFTNAEIQIYRQRQIGNASRWSISATYTVYEADIQPASATRIEMLGRKTGEVFTGYVDVDTDVKEGDELRIVDSDVIYAVQGVDRWQGAGILDHIELTLIREDDNS